MTITPSQQATHNYTVRDWLAVHNLDLKASRETIARIQRVHQPRVCEPLMGDLGLTAEEVWSISAQAIVDFVPELALEVDWLCKSCDKNLLATPDGKPCTINRGTGQSPFVVLSYQGVPADALCVAHEFGHALQYHLVGNRFIPPILRELAAFVAEKALLDYVQKTRGELYQTLYSAWQFDNCFYLGDDAEKLSAALNAATAPYTYRMNYPLARLLADAVFDKLPSVERSKIFRGSLSLAECLLIIETQKVPTAMENYLPPVSEIEKDRPAVNAYRTLGAMVLLDVDYWEGESEKSIEEYYSVRLGHMRNQTAFVAIDDDRRPIGYAVWEPDPDDASIVHLKRQAAPFGDYLKLQEKLQARLPENVTVLSHHSRSAREEQVAW